MLIRSWWLVVYAVVLQALAVVGDWLMPVVVALHASSYAVGVAFLWLNRDLLGRAVRRVRLGRRQRVPDQPAPVRDRRVIIPDEYEVEGRRTPLALERDTTAAVEPPSDVRRLEPHA